MRSVGGSVESFPSELSINGNALRSLSANGAVGIFLKAMWDTTFTDSVGDVVLDIENVSDVQKCPG
jgi:hypothetical protein